MPFLVTNDFTGSVFSDDMIARKRQRSVSAVSEAFNEPSSGLGDAETEKGQLVEQRRCCVPSKQTSTGARANTGYQTKIDRDPGLEERVREQDRERDGR